MPSLRQLQYLVDLNDTGHFRLAAEKCGVSQPTLSAQIQALERRLGTQLVERQRTPVVLTPAGRAILPLARDIMASVKRLHETAKCHAGGHCGILRIGVPVSVGPYLLPTFLPILHAKYPGLRLHVREAIPQSLPEGLNSGVYDLLITPLPLRGADFETLPVFREPLLLAVPADHRLALKEFADPCDLKGEAVLALERGHALKEQVETICDEHGAHLLHDYEGTSLSTLHQMVATGLGITILPASYAQAVEPAAGIKLLRIKGKTLQRTLGLGWRGGSPLAETCKRIGSELAQHVRQRFPEFTMLLHQ